MPKRPQDACRSCGARLLWVLTAKGKRMPLDPTPVEDGNVMVVPSTTAGRMPTSSVIPKDYPRPPGPLYQSHFASCPAVARRRQGGVRARATETR